MSNPYFSPLTGLCYSCSRTPLCTLAIIFWIFLFSGTASGQTNTWDGSSSNNWNTGSNWSLGIVPTSSHDVLIDINASILVDVTPNIRTLSISNSAVVTLTASSFSRTITIVESGSSIGSGSSLRLNGSSGLTMGISYSGTNRTMNILGALILGSSGSGGRYNASNSLTSVSGTLKLETTASSPITSSSSNLTIENAGVYEHVINAGSIPIATWNLESTCKLKGIASNFPSNSNQSFGNVTIDAISLTGTMFIPSNMIVGRDLNIVNTGNSILSLSGNTESLNGSLSR